MERSEILTAMTDPKLYGMKAAFDEITGTAVKHQQEPTRLIQRVDQTGHRGAGIADKQEPDGKGDEAKLHGRPQDESGSMTQCPRWHFPTSPLVQRAMRAAAPTATSAVSRTTLSSPARAYAASAQSCKARAADGSSPAAPPPAPA